MGARGASISSENSYSGTTFREHVVLTFTIGLSKKLVSNVSVNFCPGAPELFFDWRVKIMRATFRGVHKSVIYDNKNHSPRPSFII